MTNEQKPFRIGAVGVGPWATKLATAFRECGAEVVAYDRQRAFIEPQDGPLAIPTPLAEPFRGGAMRIPWHDQITNPEIDALIICAPPEVTTEVALECAKAGKRCVATKPLMWTEVPRSVLERFEPDQWDDLDRNLYVDLWRLYSPAWLAMKEELRGKKIERIDVAFCGNGPFRSFNGALDYGPHALAFVYDLMGTTEISLERWYNPNGIGFASEALSGRPGELVALHGQCGGTAVHMRIGNGAEKPERSVEVKVSGDAVRHGFWEPEGQSGTGGADWYRHGDCAVMHHKSLALRRFCRAFMAGESSRTLELSIAAQLVLERIVK